MLPRREQGAKLCERRAGLLMNHLRMQSMKSKCLNSICARRLAPLILCKFNAVTTGRLCKTSSVKVSRVCKHQSARICQELCQAHESSKLNIISFQELARSDTILAFIPQLYSHRHIIRRSIIVTSFNSRQGKSF